MRQSGRRFVAAIARRHDTGEYSGALEEGLTGRQLGRQRERFEAMERYEGERFDTSVGSIPVVAALPCRVLGFGFDFPARV